MIAYPSFYPSNRTQIDSSCPELIADETDSEFETEEKDADIKLSTMANFPLCYTEKRERTQIMSLVVLITSKEINKRIGQNLGTCSFLIDLIQRTKISLNQYISNLVIMQRLFSNSAATNQIADCRRLILYAFMLGSANQDNTSLINFSHWSKLTGLPVSEMTSGLVGLGRALGNLHSVRLISAPELFETSSWLKTEVKKYVKVI